MCEGNGCISTNVISQIVTDKLGEILDSDNIQLQFDTNDKKEKAPPVSNTLQLIQVKIAEADKKLERVRNAYENGVDTIEEYKANKNKIIKEVDELKRLLLEEEKQSETQIEQSDEKTNRVKDNISKLSDILKSDEVTNEEKNNVLKSIIKEIIKTGDDGRTFNIVFWEPEIA